MRSHRPLVAAATLLSLTAAAATATARLGAHPGAPAAPVPAPPPRAASAGVAAALARYDADLDTLAARLAALGASHPDSARAALLAARRAYKRVEYLAEHYMPVTAAALNGPALDRPDEEQPAVAVPATGLQVVEAALYPAPTGDAAEVLRTQARVGAVLARRLRDHAASTRVTDVQLFDAVRLEIARVTTLGVAGFDTPMTGTAAPEAAEALAAAVRALAGYGRGTAARAALDERVATTVRWLGEHADFDTLDRWEFVTAHAVPLARAVDALREAAGVPRPAGRRALSPAAVTVFDRGAFDPRAFAAPDAPAPSPALAALGRALFRAPALSGRGDRSCASCHDPARAFADGRARAARLPGAPAGTSRNTPTLLNAALQRASFADARVAFLEDQVAAVIANPAEMAGSVEGAAARLARLPAWRDAFARAFGARADTAVSGRALRQALAAYVRTLTALDSHFKRAVRGEGPGLSAAERRGFTVFMGKGKCGTCHFAPLFNGTVPPGFDESEVEVLGVPARRAWRGARADADPGAGSADRAPLHDRAFKTPTVRNAAVTAPYMHNGVYRTLEEVVEFYDRGGGAGIGARLPNQTLPPDRLRLTREEKRDLVAFLRALTDTTSR